MGNKSVETLVFFKTFERLGHISPLPPKTMLTFYFFDCTDHGAYTTLNWGAGGTRGLTLDANKIEQMLKYWKASFPKSVSTTFIAHCSFETEAQGNSEMAYCFLFAVAANYWSPPYLKFFLESLNVLSSSKDFRSCFLLLNLLCFSLQRKDSTFYDKIYSYQGRHGVRVGH